MNFTKQTLIYTGILLVLGISGGAWGQNTPTSAHPQTTSGVGTRAAASPAQTGQGKVAQTAMNGGQDKTKGEPETLQAVKVVGLRKSQMQSIELKRIAPDIQDSITAVNIGELPDVTIADSLQRITGVQVDQTAGEGTTINIRGLPEVSTLINGETFLSADNIYNIQPNYETLPSELFSGVDVLKSATADTLTSGISGTVNLHTRRPWQLPFGWTTAATVEAGRGDVAGKTKPDGNVLVGYNDHGRWGILFAASYSDFIHSWADQGWQPGQSGAIAGENSSSANGPLGYLTGWSGSPVPSQIVRFPNGAVDVNGDGKSNGAFYSPPRAYAANELVQPKRTGLSSSFQYDLGNGFTLTADGFFNKEDDTDLIASVYTLPVSQTAPTSLPAASRDTGAVLVDPFNTPGAVTGNWNQHFFAVQNYNVWIGDMEPESTGTLTRSIARNYDVELKFDNGGAFTGDLRYVTATAGQQMNNATIDLSESDGAEWPNTLKPGVTLPPTVYVHPANAGGNFPFNPNGLPQYAFAMSYNLEGRNPVASFPAGIASFLSDENNYVIKSIYGNGSSAHAGMNIIRADGHYRFSDDFSVDFGLRNSIRSARLDTYEFAAYRYAGNGATDPQGCLVRWTTSDIVLNGGGVPGACTAGNQFGFFRGNTLMGPLAKQPAIISTNMEELVNPAHVYGMVGWAVDPKSMKKPFQWYDAVESGDATTNLNPAASWNVLMKERTAYGQANFKGSIAGHSFSGNFGVRIIRTNLGVTQNVTGAVQPYGLNQLLAGTKRTNREYTDILPAINVAIDLTPKLILRLAEAKNMMPLSLDEWGGGFSTSYQITTLPNGQSVEAVTAASSSGNPDLNPWRSTNYGVSLEYYMNPSSMLSLAWFRINVASFIEQSGVLNCTLPDQDGVVRDRCVDVTQPVQGTGAVLHGFEFDYRQAFTFLPGLLSHTGAEVNGTFSPSSTNKADLAGNPVPFPDNSKKSGNLILWYQDSHVQARVAENYRSKRAVSANYAGVTGFEVYQAGTHYLDASVSYQINHNFQVFLQGENLTNERESFYLVWPDEKYNSRLSERFFLLGARFKF